MCLCLSISDEYTVIQAQQIHYKEQLSDRKTNALIKYTYIKRSGSEGRCARPPSQVEQVRSPNPGSGSSPVNAHTTPNPQERSLGPGQLEENLVEGI